MAIFALPFVVAGASKVATLVVGISAGAAVGTYVSSQVGATILPTTRRTQYDANWGQPNLQPDPGDLISSHMQGLINRNELATALRWSGIDISRQSPDPIRRDNWKAIIESKRPLPSMDTVVTWRNQGYISDDTFEWYIDRHGIRPLWINIEGTPFERQFTPFDMSFILQQFRMGRLSENEARRQLAQHGYGKKIQQDSFFIANEPLDYTIAAPLFQRGMITAERFKKEIAGSGYPDSDIQRGLLGLSYQIPGASDLIRFAVREAWQEDVVARFGYDDEFPERFEFWMKAQGYSYNPRDIVGQYPFGDNLTWPRAYWRAHWDVMSPTMGYEALHRLRGAPNDPATWRQRGTRPFTIQDMETILRIADYPAPMRRWLIATSYRVIGRIDLRRIYQTGVLGEPGGVNAAVFTPEGIPQRVGLAEKEVWESFQDQGYNQKDAATLTKWLAKDQERSRTLRGRTKAIALLSQAYELGIINRDRFLDDMQRAGVLQFEARLIADNMDLKETVDTARAARAAIKTAYMGGVLDENGIRRELANAGFALNRVNALLRKWSVERAAKPREPAVNQMCEWIGRGLITIPEMVFRLRNLNWREIDVQRIVRHCQLGHLAKAASERDRLTRAQIRQQERAQAIAERRAVRARASRESDIRRFLATRPDKYLIAWIKEELISPLEVARTLRLRGMTTLDIDRWLRTIGKFEREESSVAASESESEESTTASVAP